MQEAIPNLIVIPPREGERVFFRADRSLLEMEVLPLDAGLRACLPEKPGQVELTFLDDRGRERSFLLDNAEGVISGRGLKQLLDVHKGDYLCLEVLDETQRRYRIGGLVEDRSAEGPGFMGPVPFEDDFVHFEDENQKVLDRLEQGRFERLQWVELHNRAQRLEASLGFDTLISLDVTRDVVPYEHQLNAVRTVLRKFRGRALLCDEVGLGKTIEAGTVLLEYMMRGMVKKVLILTPPSLTAQWQEEMQRKFNLDSVLYDSKAFKEAGAEAWERFDRIIASFHTAKRREHAEKIRRIYYDMIIVDEAHHLKNRSTVVWKFVDALKKRYILLLTATPVQNDLSELFNLITLLKPGQLSTARAFTKNFVTRGDKLTPKNLPRLRSLLSQVMIRNRRSLTDVKLTKRFAHTIKVKLSDAEQAFYDEMTQFIRTEHPYLKGSGQEGTLNLFTLRTLQAEMGSSVQAALPTLARMAQNERLPEKTRKRLRTLYERGGGIREHSKVHAALEVLKAYGDKIILFTRFLQTQDFLYKVLEEAGYSTALYHGGMRRAQKEEHIKRFSEEVQILISTEVGGEGRNLQFCNAMLNYDLPWNPMKIEQRIGRIHRVGQKRDVHIFNLSAEGTIEAYVLYLLDAKINLFEMVIGELDMILGSLEDDREFEDIIMDILVESHSEEELSERMEAFGERLVRARQEYLRVRQYDEKLFRALEKDA